MAIKKLMHKGLGVFKHRLLSGRCLGCLAPAQDELPLCIACEENLALNNHACRQCAAPITTAQHLVQPAFLLCVPCQHDSPPFQKTVSPYLYSYPLDRFVNRFKQDQQLIYGRLLARLMARNLHLHYQDSDHSLPDQIIAVPSHKKRRFKRGFNPAALLADEVAKTLQRPFNPKLCQKITDTAEQHTLDRQARLKNLQGSFSLTEPVTDQHIAVVDDVMTTGATAGVIAELLRDNGAKEVHIWTLARTPYQPKI